MTPTTQPARARRFVGWRIVVLATITAAMTGPGQTIGVSVFVDPLIEDLSLTRSQVSTAYLIGTLLGALALPSVGHWVDRLGARRAMTFIGLGFGAGLTVMSGVGGFVTLAIGFTLIRWLGQGSLSLVSTVAVTHWFERRRGVVFGVMMTAVSALMALTPVLLNLAIEAYSWRTAWLLAAAAVWLVVVPIGYFGIVDRPAHVGQHVDGDPAPPLADKSMAARSHSRREAVGESRCREGREGHGDDEERERSHGFRPLARDLEVHGARPPTTRGARTGRSLRGFRVSGSGGRRWPRRSP